MTSSAEVDESGNQNVIFVNSSKKGICSGGKVLSSAKAITAVERFFGVRKRRASNTDATTTTELAFVLAAASNPYGNGRIRESSSSPLRLLGSNPDDGIFSSNMVF